MSNSACTTTDLFYAIRVADEYKFIHLVLEEEIPTVAMSPLINTWGEWLIRNNNLIQDICNIAIRTNIETE